MTDEKQGPQETDYAGEKMPVGQTRDPQPEAEAQPEVDHRSMKLGKKPAVVPPHSLRLAAYASTGEMTYPEAYDGTGGFSAWGVLGNDRLGDCTIASKMHGQQAVSFVAYGKAPAFDTADAVRYYELWDGYDPRNPQATDQGGVISDVLQKWYAQGLKDDKGGVHRVVSYGYIDPKDVATVKHFCAAFGYVDLGMNLPNSCLTQATWTVVPDDGGIAGGHDITMVGFDPEYVIFISWGKKMRMTWEFFAAYCDEAWGVLLAGHVKNGMAGTVDVKTLEADAERHLRRSA